METSLTDKVVPKTGSKGKVNIQGWDQEQPSECDWAEHSTFDGLLSPFSDFCQWFLPWIGLNVKE